MIGKSVGKSQARKRAQDVFQAYKARGGDIPIDIEAILKRHGIHLVMREASTDLAGMLLVDEDQAIIAVNEGHPEVRRRFTLAHELGHFLLHRQPGSAIFHRDEKSSEGTDRTEIDANAFAAELLMPAEEVRHYAVQLHIDLLADEELYKLSKKFKVSPQAMSIRLQQLKLIQL